MAIADAKLSGSVPLARAMDELPMAIEPASLFGPAEAFNDCAETPMAMPRLFCARAFVPTATPSPFDVDALAPTAVPLEKVVTVAPLPTATLEPDMAAVDAPVPTARLLAWPLLVPPDTDWAPAPVAATMLIPAARPTAAPSARLLPRNPRTASRSDRLNRRCSARVRSRWIKPRGAV